MKSKKILKIIGGNIRKYRLRSDLTQEDLAKKLELTRVSVVNIESGRQAIPIYRIILLCAILKITPNKLFKIKTK